MGKYTKKHVWMPCEYVYKINYYDKNAGAHCDEPTRKNYGGKYYCWKHNPRRILADKLSKIRQHTKNIGKQEARLKARKDEIAFYLELVNKKLFEQTSPPINESVPNPVIS